MAAIDTKIAEFLGLIEHLATQYARFAANDYDDLRQEGMIAVWHAFERGQAPTEQIIRWRMRDYLKRTRERGTYTPLEYDPNVMFLDDPAPGKSPVLGQ